MKAKTSGHRGKRPILAPEDEALFREAMGDVTPLGARDRVPAPKPPPAVVKVVELPPEVKLTVEGDGQRYAARAPGVSHTQIIELRAGKVHATATLDLHGTTIAPALAQLRQFLLESRRIGHRCVLIVHGRGLHSEQGAPLREAVISEFLGPLSGLVHAFASAAPADGGDGATYVVLRGPR
jgi:DNA-nicking Smr family endonuclease